MAIDKRIYRRKVYDVQQRFNHLHNVKRMRIDDVIEQLCQEFYAREWTIRQYLRLDPEEV